MNGVKLSIIIVNYNVRYFLEQCLHSVFKAIEGVDSEIFVVDNNSSDNSCLMVEKKFPTVKLIKNKENAGFSKANNQAIKLSKGEYVLLLNPDTIVQEDTLRKTVAFMDATPDAGGLGVKMIDGNGIFLPESKRGLPTPKIAFYKIFGLSKLFPKSHKFGQYHLKYLDMNKTHQVDVLSGAFMLLRKETLEKVGLLDETFFMYGEDIDLSYRIVQGNYKNYYFADTTIIHYKGESTKKNSINYVLIFYTAMAIFFRKHFRSKLTGLFSTGVKLAIYLRAAMAIFRRFFIKIFVPSIDAVVIWLFFFFALPFWEDIRFGADGKGYPQSYMSIAVPIYILIWIITIIYSGGYDKNFKFSKLWKGIGTGSAFIILFYSLLPEEYRYSRAMILFATTFAVLVLSLLRFVYMKLNISGYLCGNKKNNRILIAGNPPEISRTLSIISNNFADYTYIGYINDTVDDNKLGSIEGLPDIINIHRINEIIFCSSSVNNSEIIDAMMMLQSSGVTFKIASPDGVSMISSSSAITNAELFEIEINSISTTSNKRIKRTFDVILSLFLLISLPITFFTVKRGKQLFLNIVSVLFGKKTWVGFSENNNAVLPKIKSGVLNPAMIHQKRNISKTTIDKINRLYAKDYKLFNDIIIVIRCWKFLGNS